MADPATRFMKNVQKTETCWLWTGCLNRDGYGRFTIGYRDLLAHRWSYEFHVGTTPAGYVLDHVKDRCSNRNCVNPDHLEPVTSRENTMRGSGITAQNARRTLCAKGHTFDSVDANGKRYCRVCSNERSRKHYAKKKATA